MSQKTSKIWLKPPETLRMKINDLLSSENSGNEDILLKIQESTCSVSHVSNIAGALISIESIDNKKGIFEWALNAGNEDECRRSIALTKLAWLYHMNIMSIERLSIKQNNLVAKDTLGKQIIFLVADYLTWNETLDNLLNLYAVQSVERIIYVSNNVSDIAKKEIEKRNIIILSNVFASNNEIILAEFLFSDEYEEDLDQSANQTGELLKDTTNEATDAVEGLLDGAMSIFK